MTFGLLTANYSAHRIRLIVKQHKINNNNNTISTRKFEERNQNAVYKRTGWETVQCFFLVGKRANTIRYNYSLQSPVNENVFLTVGTNNISRVVELGFRYTSHSPSPKLAV